MIALGTFKEFLEPFGWFLTLGRADTDRIKDEIQDLLQHSSQSLRSLLELTEIMRDIPRIEFYEGTFWPIANHCLWFFTSPAAAQKARTRWTDMERDLKSGPWSGPCPLLRAARLPDDEPAGPRHRDRPDAEGRDPHSRSPELETRRGRRP